MDMLNNLRTITEDLIIKTSDEKYELIKKILSDDECFFKLDMDIALDILSSLGISNTYEYYKELIDSDNYINETSVKVID